MDQRQRPDLGMRERPRDEMLRAGGAKEMEESRIDDFFIRRNTRLAGPRTRDFLSFAGGEKKRGDRAALIS